jgi:hypothetical protein
MRASTLIRTAAAVCAAGLFAGCAGTSTSTQMTPQVRGATAHADSRPSWVDPAAKSGKLLYVSMAGNDDVNMYAYPSLKLAGSLTGLQWPEGMCTDATGNVWITNYELHGYLPGFVTEYAHGGKAVLKTLEDGVQSPGDCSFDPTTGNLAVANRIAAEGSPINGNVGIYVKADGDPVTYSSPDMEFYYWCTYDDKGNLYVNGFNQASQVVFAELPKGSKKLKTLQLDEPITWPVGMKWDGQYLAAGNGDDENPIVYRFKITGNKAKTVSSLTLDGAASIGQFAFFDNKLIVPSVNNGTVGLYKYPKGGNPAKSITPNNEPVGTVVSVGK